MEKPPNLVVRLGEHPLQNQVILKVLFDLIEPSTTLYDWKKIRLVCKLWHSESLSKWRNNAVLDLVEETPFFQPPSEKLTPTNLLIQWLNPNGPYKLKEKPYLNYQLEAQTISLPFCDSSLTARLFWSTVGPWMRSLIFRDVDFETRDEGTSELLQFLIDKTPNLEQVTFDSLKWGGEETANFPKDSWSQDLKSLECASVVSLTYIDSFMYPLYCFPNLQKIRFEFFKFLDSLEPIELVKLLEILELLLFPDFSTIPEHNPLQYSKVTHLDMMNCAVDESVRRQTNIKFPFLEHLSFNLSYAPRHSNDQPFSEFGNSMIANHRETLKVLKAFCWIPPRFGDWTIKYPMHVLSKLFLWGNCIDNLDFLRFTPNLTLLHIDLYGFEKQEEMRSLVQDAPIQIMTQRAYIPTGDIVEASRLSGNLTGVVLSELQHFQLNHIVGSESVRALGEWMPNLKIFKGVLDSSSLPIVCEVWPKLEKLHCLFGSEIVEEDVVGTTGSRKGVATLKILRSFHYNSRCDNSSLSDKSVKEGFLKMKELTDLQICVSKDFSRESEDALNSQIQNVKVYRNYSENEDHKDWKCCRDNMYLQHIEPAFQDCLTM